MPAVKVDNLTKTYTTFRKGEGMGGALKSLFRREVVRKEAVCGVSFTIESGELVGFLGPNGAGKTTVMKMLSGILYPTSGSISVLGHVPWRREKAFLKRLALVMGQKAQLNWDLPAADSFLLNRDIYEIAPEVYRRRLDELVELFDIREFLHVPVRQLSLGERMKCELVASLLPAPDVLLLDEPTIGLDIVSQKKLRTFLKTYQEQHHTTMLLTSHYMQDIQELCSRVVVIDHGVVIFSGPLTQLLQQVRQRRRLRLAFTADQTAMLSRMRTELEAHGQVLSLTGWDAVLEVDSRNSTEILAALLNKLPLADVAIEEAGIEDAMTELFSGNAHHSTGWEADR